MKYLKPLLLIALIGLTFFGLYYSSQRSATVFSGSTMGTTYTVKVIATIDSLKKQQIQQDIDKILLDINTQMSTYIADSQITTFNKQQTTDF